MNCDSFLQILDEIPLARWSPAQKTSAFAHCLTCENCESKLQQQQRLFAVFEEMILPTPGQVMPPLPELPSRQGSSWSGWFQPGLSAAVALFLCAGSALQLFRESGFSWYWFADGRRVEAVSTLLYNSPLLSAALMLAGLVYCFFRRSQGTFE